LAGGASKKRQEFFDLLLLEYRKSRIRQRNSKKRSNLRDKNLGAEGKALIPSKSNMSRGDILKNKLNFLLNNLISTMYFQVEVHMF